MRISDWSSDVCSSDLPDAGGGDFDFSKAKQNFGEPVPTFEQHWRIDGLRRLLRRSRRFTGPNRLDIIQHVFDILTARRLRRDILGFVGLALGPVHYHRPRPDIFQHALDGWPRAGGRADRKSVV